jgi:hypothetical protein
MAYRTPELTLVGDARGIVLGRVLTNLEADHSDGTPWSIIKPYTTHEFV